MTFLATGGNTLIPAYLCLVAKGYAVDVVRPTLPSSPEQWSADNGTARFLAADTVSLLGLVHLYELRGESWPATDAQISAFLARYGCEP